MKDMTLGELIDLIHDDELSDILRSALSNYTRLMASPDPTLAHLGRDAMWTTQALVTALLVAQTEEAKASFSALLYRNELDKIRRQEELMVAQALDDLSEALVETHEEFVKTNELFRAFNRRGSNND